MKQTIKSTNQLIQEHITSTIRKSFTLEKLLIELDGVLGDIKAAPSEYKYHYGIKLKDQQEFILLDIPKDLIEAGKLTGGEYVTVFGIIKTKLDNYTNNRLEFRIDVSKIQATDSPAAIDAHRQEQASLSKIRALNAGRNTFPFKEEIKISLITGRSSQVEDDFRNELKKIKSRVFVQKIAVDMTNKDEIVRAIESANHKADIIAVIRGGGDDSQFEAFNNMSVITALSKSSGYRILGLGHSQDSTLLELVCDYSANTPTAAGTHIREMLTSYQDNINNLTVLHTLENRDNQQIIDSLKAEHLVQRNKLLKNCGIVILVLIAIIVLLIYYK